MTVEPSYRIDLGRLTYPSDEEHVDDFIDTGVLVPDTRLQAIADEAGEPFMWCFTHGQKRLQCEWAKKLYECSDVDDAVIVRTSQLDVLTEETNLGEPTS